MNGSQNYMTKKLLLYIHIRETGIKSKIQSFTHSHLKCNFQGFMSIYLLILLEAMLPCAALYTAPHDAQITKNTFLLQILLRSVNAGCRNAAFPFTLIMLMKHNYIQIFLVQTSRNNQSHNFSRAFFTELLSNFCRNAVKSVPNK